MKINDMYIGMRWIEYIHTIHSEGPTYEIYGSIREGLLG